uniref:R5 n=1 Tax=Toxoplasma gondii TaxID=5811 RepID=Q86PI0_TOXGO|nr:R5 [Toxoplasma gondii]
MEKCFIRDNVHKDFATNFIRVLCLVVDCGFMLEQSRTVTP